MTDFNALNTRAYTTSKNSIPFSYNSGYCQSAGGMTNAMTQLDRTIYYFKVLPDKLGGAIDRFAQFFKTPLFNSVYSEREVNAVDSEFVMSKTSDGRRMLQVELGTFHPDHLLYKLFACGNKDTLTSCAAQNDITLETALRQFFQRFYSANIMTLAIVGNESLDDLTKMAVEMFGDIPNKQVRVPRESAWNPSKVPLYDIRTPLPKMQLLVPVADRKEVAFKWQVPTSGEMKRWMDKGASLVLHALGHEGKGTLLSAFKKNGWANGLTASQTMDDAGQGVMSVDVELTDAAFENGEEVVREIGEMIFAYINAMRAASEEDFRVMFRDNKKLAKIMFAKQETMEVEDLVMMLVQSASSKQPRKRLLSSCEPHMVWKFDFEEVSAC